MASVSITGSGGVVMTGSTQPIGQTVGAPPELHLTQWGVYRIDIGHRPEEPA